MKKIIFSLIIMCSLFLLTGCGQNKLVGTWYYFDNSEVSKSIYYKFNDDKTGNYVTNTENRSFIYEIKSNKLILSYVNSDTNVEREYKIENDILTIKDPFLGTVNYKK